MLRVFLKHHPSVTDVVSVLTKGNRLSIPVIDSQVSPCWWRRWPEAGDPLTGMEDMGGCPGAVPPAGHPLGGGTPAGGEELPGGATGVPAHMKSYTVISYVRLEL